MTPLRAACFVSGTGNNLQTALAFSRHRPDLLSLPVVVTNRPSSRAAAIARQAGVRLVEHDFDSVVGRASHCQTEQELLLYHQRARALHDQINAELYALEHEVGELDLLVFAYSRWVQGDLLDRFSGRIINQHPGDLGLLEPDGGRSLTGNNPVLRALQRGDASVRTSTFVVDKGQDSGSILVRGPRIAVPTASPISQLAADRLEEKQKRASDRAALLAALLLWSSERPRYGAGLHEDGSRVLLLAGGGELPRTGVDVEVRETSLMVQCAALGTDRLEGLTTELSALYAPALEAVKPLGIGTQAYSHEPAELKERL